MRRLPLEHPALTCGRTHGQHPPHLHPPCRDGRGLHCLVSSAGAQGHGCSLAEEPQRGFVLLAVTFVRFSLKKKRNYVPGTDVCTVQTLAGTSPCYRGSEQCGVTVLQSFSS